MGVIKVDWLAWVVCRNLVATLLAILVCFFAVPATFATPYTETVPNGNGPIPITYPPVGGTMFVLIGANGNIYYQFVNPSTQFQGFQFTGNPAAFRGNPFQLGPTQTLNCGPTACIDYFGGSIIEGYARLTARDGDACPGNFDFNDVFFEVNGIRVGSFSGRPANSVERTSRDGATSIGFEDCFRNQGSNETSTGWFDLTPVPGLLNNILTVGSTTPFVFDDDGSANRGDNFWFFRDGNDATGTPEVAPGIEIIKTADVTSYSAAGDTINYSFEVTNIGSVTLSNVVVTDPFITGTISCPLTTLVSAQSMVCTAQHVVSQQNIDDDIVFVNTAEVVAVPTEGTLGNVSGTITIPGPAANNSATITKTPNITSGADVGDTITYTYVVTNTGNITLDNVAIADAHNGVGTLSAVANEALTNTSGLSIDTTPNDGLINALSPGDSATFEATYVVQQGDVDAQTNITNTATLLATPRRGPITLPNDNAAVGVVTGTPALSIDKSTTATGFSSLGEVIPYNYLVTNSGNVSITAPISVSDDVINSAGGNVSCPGLPVGGLAPGASLTCTGNYAVTQADLNTGVITNIASATDGTTTSPTDTVTVNGTQTPELSIDKRLQAASPTSYTADGDTLLYEYEVRNTGNVTITAAVTVADDIVDGAGGSVSCPAIPAGGLLPNATIVCTASYSVTQIDVDNGSVTNTATATDGSVTSASDSVTVNAIQSPSLGVTKTAQPFPPANFIVGSTVIYDYLVENTGNTTITSPITVSDNRIASVTCDPLPVGGLAPSDTLSCAGSYVVDVNDVALGSVTNLATATDGTTTSPQTSETIPSGANPALGLTKEADVPATFAMVGDTINYTFTVTNTGNVSFATDITVVDALLPGSPITCFTSTPTNPDLIPGESITCSGSYTVDQNDLDAGEVFNEATANTTFAGTTPVVSDPATETVSGNVTPSLNVTKSAAPTTFTAAGETLVYTISVENDGNQTLTNITVSDPLIPTLMCTIPTLAPGATDTSCVGNYVVQQSDVNSGVITNIATATGSDPAGGTVTDTGTLDTNGPGPAPSVEVMKTASPSPFGAVGSAVTYSFEVRNTGNVTLDSIVVTDPLVPAFTCNIASLLPGTSDSTTCSLNYTVQQIDIDNGSITNTAAVEAVSTDPSGQTVNDTDQITTNGPSQAPELALEKVADTSGLSSPPQVGDTITYTFRVENTGNVTLTNITLSDPDATVSGGPIVSLEPGDVDTATFTATYDLTQSDINSGSFSNQATVSGTPPGGGAPITDLSDDPADPTSGDDPTVVDIPQTPSIELTKFGTFDDGGNGIADIGDQINFTFRVENTGNVELTNITISDPGAIISGGPIASLQPGQSDIVTFTGAIQITQDNIDDGQYTNQATVSGTPPGGGAPVTDLSDDPSDGTSDDDPTVTLIPQAPAFSMVKTATNVVFTLPGDISTFEYVVTNTGNTRITQPITVTDNLIPTVNCPPLPPGGLDPGASITCSGSYAATQQDLDNGSVTNIATATDGTTTSPIAEETIPATQNPALTISKSSPDTTFSVVGDVLNYTFELTNAGNLTLTGTTQVVDDRIGTIDCFVGNFVPGSTQTCNASYTVTQADLDAGFVTNQAFGQNGTIVSPPDSVTINATQTPSLLIDKSSTDTTYTAVGDVLTYSYEVTNNGNVTLTTPISVADDIINAAGDLVTCPALPVGGLAPGSSITCTGTYSVTQDDLNAGSVTNTATASDGTTTSPSDDVTINATQLPELSLEKEGTLNDGGDGSVDVGDTITYTFRVENTGNVTLTNITLSDPDATVSGGPILTLLPGAVDTVTFTAVRVLDQDDINAGSFSNQATVSGTPPGGGAPITDLSDDPNDGTSDDDPTVITIPAAPSIEVLKIGDISGFSSPPTVGDIISYSFRVENTGNVTLTNITLSDPAAVVSGGPIGSLLPGQSDLTTFTASRALTQDDIDAGSFTNQATVSGTPPGGGAPVTDLSDDPNDPTDTDLNGDGNPDDETVTIIPATPALELEKSVGSFSQIFPFVYDIEYVIDVTNSGNVTSNTVMVTDDLAAAMAPGSLISTDVTISGFGGSAVANPSFDGFAVTDLVQGTAILAPGQTGTISLTVRVDFSAGFPSQSNTAFGLSDEVPGPVPSDDPNVTPGDPGDVNPTPFPIEDLDGDGSPDDIESGTGDRDGDGVNDAADYDPTGYFYCQEDGRILSGGLISVTGPAGTQSGIGTSNNITIVQDGSGGFYQFHVSAPGTYTLNLTYPATGVPSVDRIPLAPLDVSTRTDNPAVLGAGEVGATGVLSDFTAGANPFHVAFDIEAGDPSVFNNNIPLQFCGTPEVTASKSVQGTPVLLGNGGTEVVFRLGAENTSTTQVNDVSLVDDLDAVFGAGNYTVTNTVIVASPTGFGATADPAFDGGANTNTLTAGGNLLPGETVTVDITVEVAPAASGSFTNTVTAGGASPLDGSPIADDDATTDIDIAASSDVTPLIVEKVAARPVVRIGEILPYTITIRNTEGLDRVGVDIVDFLPAGLTYRPGSATIDGVATEPVISGRRMVFAGQTIPANGSVTIVFNVGISAAASAIEFENRAWVEDPSTGNRISNVGIAIVRREIEHVFDCGEIIGKVFDDTNNNGYQDEGEPGLAGVRVATVKGELITTDKHGRFHVPCASIPDADIGSNFILKLDERTLPSGYRVTTENPRVVRLTRGKLTKLNFGASISRVVRIDVNSAAFNGDAPSAALENAIPQLIDHLGEQVSVLRLSYQSNGEGKKLARERMRNLSRMIERRWKREGSDYDLQIETRIVAKN